jgi:hypothetical protein
MKRIKAILMVAAVMAVAMSFAIAPASADPGVGQVAFTCTANLPNFPAPNGAGGTCSGTATGFVAGAGGAHTAVQGAFNANFSYNEPLATCPATGTANGQFTITTSAGTVSGNFSWTRAGATAVITLSSVNGAGLTNASGEAVAGFESPNAVSNCLAGGGPLTATVAGEATVHDTN